MVGDRELRKACKQYVQESQLPVIFTSFLNQSEIVNAYLALDYLVLRSDHGETWDLVVHEAMACELPVNVRDQVGCFRDLISDGETGFAFPLGNWNRLTKQIAKAASN
jgi:glycosyltransferase involved in cell wall biosynthesis